MYTNNEFTVNQVVVQGQVYLVLRRPHDEGTEVYLLTLEGQDLEVVYHISQDLGDGLYDSDEVVIEDWVMSKTQ